MTALCCWIPSSDVQASGAFCLRYHPPVGWPPKPTTQIPATKKALPQYVSLVGFTSCTNIFCLTGGLLLIRATNKARFCRGRTLLRPAPAEPSVLWEEPVQIDTALAACMARRSATPVRYQAWLSQGQRQQPYRIPVIRYTWERRCAEFRGSPDAVQISHQIDGHQQAIILDDSESEQYAAEDDM